MQIIQTWSTRCGLRGGLEHTKLPRQFENKLQHPKTNDSVCRPIPPDLSFRAFQGDKSARGVLLWVDENSGKWSELVIIRESSLALAAL